MAQSLPILAIVGVTGSGKNELAQEVARRTGASLVSVDSRKVYRGLDIGTAKPKPEVIREFDYGMIDCADPIEHFSAARYTSEARAIVAERLKTGRPVIMVGGTGFYLDAFIHGLTDLPQISESTRQRLVREADARGWESLYDEAKLADPDFMSRVHPGDKTRIRRVLETWWQTGDRLSELLHGSKSSPNPWTVRVVWPDLDRVLSRARIRQRVGRMREDGLTAEVRGLLEAGIPAGAPGLATVGYREIVGFLSGKCDEEQAFEKVINNSCRYAKRQETWFRHRSYVLQVSGYPIEPEWIIDIWRGE